MHGDGGSGYRGDVRVVIGWRNFYNISALDIKPPELLQHRKHLALEGPPATGVPVPGAKAGSRQSMSKVT
jgi:hypothetical protein